MILKTSDKVLYSRTLECTPTETRCTKPLSKRSVCPNMLDMTVARLDSSHIDTSASQLLTVVSFAGESTKPVGGLFSRQITLRLA